MSFAPGHAKAGGRKNGARNKRTLVAAARPDALAHLEKVMTSTDGTITPDLKLRAAGPSHRNGWRARSTR